jgi:hypothetical protein
MNNMLLDILRKDTPTDYDRERVRKFPLAYNLIIQCYRDREGGSAFPMHYWIAQEISNGVLDTSKKLQSMACGTDGERLLARLFARDWVTSYGAILFIAKQVRGSLLSTFNWDAFKLALQKSGEVLAQSIREPLERAVMFDAVRWIEENEAGLEVKEQLQDRAPEGVKTGLGMLRRELATWENKNKIMRGDPRDGWTVGKFTVITWGKSVQYPIEGEMKPFPINGKARWQDIEDLMNAKCEYVKMRTGFAQRWNKGEYQELKKAAFPAEEKSPKGKGRYRLLK